MRQFMLESVKYWIDEFHIDGFRFDLMGVHDIETMQAIREMVNRIDPSIYIYGEGWSAGSCAYPTEKLAMKGAAINVENIGKTVTDGFEKVNDYVRSDRPRSILQKIGEGIVSVAGFLIKFLLVFIAICCAPVLFVLLIVFFALLMAATGLIAAVPAVLYEVLPAVNWATVGSSPGLTVAMSVAGILVIGIPIIGLIHMLMRHFGGWQPMSIVTKIIFIVLWLIALGVGVFFVLNDPNIASMISYSL